MKPDVPFFLGRSGGLAEGLLWRELPRVICRFTFQLSVLPVHRAHTPARVQQQENRERRDVMRDSCWLGGAEGFGFGLNILDTC